VQLTLSNTVDGSSLLFGQVKPIARVEILANVPPKSKTDKLIQQFFDRDTFPITVARKSRLLVFQIRHKLTKSPAIIHEPTFMREVLILPKFNRIILLIPSSTLSIGETLPGQISYG
jgi:hypothetical protein